MSPLSGGSSPQIPLNAFQTVTTLLPLHSSGLVLLVVLPILIESATPSPEAGDLASRVAALGGEAPAQGSGSDGAETPPGEGGLISTGGVHPQAPPLFLPTSLARAMEGLSHLTDKGNLEHPSPLEGSRPSQESSSSQKKASLPREARALPPLLSRGERGPSSEAITLKRGERERGSAAKEETRTALHPQASESPQGAPSARKEKLIPLVVLNVLMQQQTQRVKRKKSMPLDPQASGEEKSSGREREKPPFTASKIDPGHLSIKATTEKVPAASAHAEATSKEGKKADEVKEPPAPSREEATALAASLPSERRESKESSGREEALLKRGVESLPSHRQEGRLLPRHDMILPLKMSEQGVATPWLYPGEFPKEFFMIPQEAPFNREAIFRSADHPRNALLNQEQGFLMSDLLILIFSGVIAGFKSSVEILRYLQRHEKGICGWLGLKYGLPPFRLIWFFLNRWRPERVIPLLSSFLGSQTLPRELLQIRVWESNRGMVLGDLSPEAKFSTALWPHILAAFSWKGSAVTLESIDWPQELGQQLYHGGAELLFHLTSHEEAHFAITHSLFQSEEGPYESYQDRVEEPGVIHLRRIRMRQALQDASPLPLWPFFHSAGEMRAEVITSGGHTLLEEYYLSSLGGDPQAMARTLRLLQLLDVSPGSWLDADFFFRGGVIESERENLVLLDSLAQKLVKAHALHHTITPPAERGRVEYLHSLFSFFAQEPFPQAG